MGYLVQVFSYHLGFTKCRELGRVKEEEEGGGEGGGLGRGKGCLSTNLVAYQAGA